MAKVGSDSGVGTAEGALQGRAAHALHAKEPVLDDFWAVELLTPAAQAAARDVESYRRAQASPMAGIGAVNIGALRAAEDLVVECVEDGIDQYVLLGAGFDTFALRRKDLVGRLAVFEVDHPEVQALKRARIEAARSTPAALPEFVPVDFEITSLAAGLAASRFQPGRRAVFSWMNTLPYLTEDAVASTLGDLSLLAAPGSRVIANYIPVAQPTPEQAARMNAMSQYASAVGEVHRQPWEPDVLARLLGDEGFAVVEHLTEEDLAERYFRDREDGLTPGMPQRIVIAERTSAPGGAT